MFRQLPLPVFWAFSNKSEDFVISECNSYAFNWLEKWPFKIHENFVCLVGESGSGKTHMANIWASRLNADIIDSKSNVFDKWYNISSSNSGQKFFVLNDADKIKEEILLFYVYNTIIEKDAYLLMTAKTNPSYWKLSLPDLKSRITTINVVNIEKPNDKAIIEIMDKMLKQRGIKMQYECLKYISKRIERSYESINYWVKQMDSSVSTNKTLTLSTIRKLMKSFEIS
ncbi:MAG: hypothetical protein LBF70_00110 [Holosporales bacterium]|nr:hypothetical protein [Holosporales bacterium]